MLKLCTYSTVLCENILYINKRQKHIDWTQTFDPHCNVDNNGKLKSIDICYKVTPKYSDWVSIKDPRFKNKENLYGPTAKLPVVPIESNLNAKYFPKMWLSSGTIQKIPEQKPVNDVGTMIPTKFPNHYILNCPIENFRIYVNKKDFFISKLPLLPEITTSYEKGTWGDNEIYYQIIFSIYCATYCCGISIQHLTPNDDPIIMSLMRFHFYFTVRRLIRRMEGGELMSNISTEFNPGKLYQNNDHIRRWMYYTGSEEKIQKFINNVKDGFGFYNRHYQPRTERYFLKSRGQEKWILFPYTIKSDYKVYVPLKSDGFTKIGIQYLNELIEPFLYSILGAQARTEQSIYSNRVSALETQQEFRSIVEDSILNYNVST